MLKASALYMVIVIALVIAIICSSLIVCAYFYRLQSQKTSRMIALENNVNSGINILLASNDTSFLNEQKSSLYNSDGDSVAIKRIPWGIFDIGIAKAFIQQDTLFKVFSIANAIDSSKWAVLYITDNDHNIVVSGKTAITGTVFIPRAGVQSAFVNNNAYAGDKRMVIGKINNSAKTLPELSADKLSYLENFLNQKNNTDTLPPVTDSVTNSFLRPTRIFNLGKNVYTLKNISITGNIVIKSDTTLIIDSTTKLNHILIFAQSISVKEGFKGNCQLFATDTIGVEKNCRFDYPSCLGVLRFDQALVSTAEQINLQNNVLFNGLIFTYEKAENKALPVITIGSHSKITGQVYAPGFLAYKGSTEIDGSVFANRFLYRTNISTLINNLINIKLNEQLISPYYLTSDLLPAATNKKKILEWIEGN